MIKKRPDSAYRIRSLSSIAATIYFCGTGVGIGVGAARLCSFSSNNAWPLPWGTAPCEREPCSKALAQLLLLPPFGSNNKTFAEPLLLQASLRRLQLHSLQKPPPQQSNCSSTDSLCLKTRSHFDLRGGMLTDVSGKVNRF
jgi:hypothetical protein